MKIHYIVHAPFEKIGVIQNWVNQKGYELKGTRTYAGEILPDVNEFDFLIIMGGPQSATELAKWPYLHDEINLIRAAIDAQKVVLGFCLGAQLIAESLGAKTQRSPHREIGVYPVELLPQAQQDPLFSQLPAIFSVLHWHNDMPTIPQGARLLAKSMGCPHQAFGFGDRVYGLQFHLEMTTANISQMVEHCADDLIVDDYVQSKEQLLIQDLTELNQKLFFILDYLSKKVITSEGVATLENHF